MQQLVGQVIKYELDSYNRQGHSDYWWERVDGVIKQVERKTWQEILSGVDKIEEQLSRHLSDKPNAEHILLLEGPITAKGDFIQAYSSKGNGFSVGRPYRQNITGIYAWLYQISHYYTIVPTYNIEGSAAALIAMFKSDGQDNHSTLNRNYARRSFHRDPIVEKYMGVLDGIGDTKAEELRKVFPTIASLVAAKRNDFIVLPGFGANLADKIMRQLGTFTQPKVRNES